MAKKNSMFRKESLDRLASPDQLDQLVHVTSPTGWLALSGCLLIIGAAIVWGVKGEVQTNVLGQCILMKSGGIKEITFSAGGRLTDLSVKEGDFIEQGQVIARVEQAELISRLRNLEEDRDDLFFMGKANNVLMESKKQELVNRIDVLEERIESRNLLLLDGLVTKQMVNEDKNRLQALKNEFKQLPLSKVELKNQLDQADRSIAALLRNLDEASAVYSRYSGRVLEVVVSDGQLVRPGSRMLNLEPSGLSIKNLEAVIYVPAAGGKQIQPGMSVKLSPSTVKREEFGSIIANVTRVSAFPSTYSGMMNNLQNEELVRMLSSSSSIIEVVADLIPDTSNFSGYRWTSPSGPPVKIESGTICRAQITTREQAPITLVIPAAKKFLGV